MNKKRRLPERATVTEGAELAKRAAGSLMRRTAIVKPSHADLSHADKIQIDGLEVFASHGVYPEENALVQKFVVSLTLFCDLHRAGKTDKLDESIDYGSVCHITDDYLRAHTFKLIEAAAEGPAAHLLERFPSLMGVRVKLEKPWAPVGLPLTSVGVEIERAR